MWLTTAATLDIVRIISDLLLLLLLLFGTCKAKVLTLNLPRTSFYYYYAIKLKNVQTGLE